MSISSVDINKDTGFGRIKLQINGKPFKFNIQTIKEKEDCMISSVTFITFLGPRKFLNIIK